MAQVDVEAPARQIDAGIRTDCDVVGAPGVVKERGDADGGVTVAIVLQQRVDADSGTVEAGEVVPERVGSDSGIRDAGSVERERQLSNGGVVVAVVGTVSF